MATSATRLFLFSVLFILFLSAAQCLFGRLLNVLGLPRALHRVAEHGVNVTRFLRATLVAIGHDPFTY